MTRAITLLSLLITASCAVPLDEKERNCPCSEGWACCELTNTCVAEQSYDILCTSSKSDGGVKEDTNGSSSKPDADIPGTKSDGGKQQIICVPKQAECVDLRIKRTCDASGTMWAEEPCHDGHRCDNGACVQAEKIVGSLRFSISVRAKDLLLDIDPGEYVTRIGLAANFHYSSDGLVDSDSSGPEGCIKNDLSSPNPTPDPGVPFDAGTINVTDPSGTYAFTYDPAKELYSGKIDSFDSHFSPFPGFGKQLTYSGAGKGLAGAFSGSITWPPKRLFTRPGPREELTNKKNAPFDIEWSGSTGKGQIGFYLIGTPEEIPPGTWMPPDQIYCKADDDGAFTVPANIMKYFESYPKVMLFMRMTEYVTPFTAAGLSETEVVVDYSYSPSKLLLLTP